MEEQRLEMVACTGDVEALNRLLQEKPFILSDSTIINTPSVNILSTAIKSNQLQISLRIAKTYPPLLTAMDKDGVRPLDVASAYGFVEIVRKFLILSPDPAETCRLPGRDGKTAIHHASINGRVDVIDELLAKCPDCIIDCTSFGETALHLSIKYFQSEVTKRLMQFLETSAHAEELINCKDRDGNTILHYAVSKKQLEVLELLLDKNKSPRIGNAVEVNALNSNNLTPTDLLNIFIESSSDSHMKELLRLAGGRGSHDTEAVIISLENPQITTTHVDNYPHKPRNFRKTLEYLELEWEKVSVLDVRNTLLVVAVLFITVAFQGGTNLPTHIFPDDSNARKPVVAQGVYLALNTLVLSGPMAIIQYLTSNMPFQREIRVAALSLMGAYGCSIGAAGLPLPISLPIFFLPLVMSLLRRITMTLAGRKRNINPTHGQEAP